MPAGPAILALDLGSTSIKCALFDSSLRECGRGQARLEYRNGPGGQVELEAEPLADSIRSVIRQARASAPPSLVPGAVALTGQAQTFTRTDAANRPFHPFISWQDTRAREAADLLAAQPPLHDFSSHASPGQLLPALLCAHLHRLKREEAGPGNFLLRPLPAWLNAAWCGEAAWDDNQAAMTGLYSLEAGDWWADMLTALDLVPEQLPRLTPVGTAPCRTTGAAESWGLPAGIPVVLAGNDQTAGAYGAAIERRGGTLVTLGTAQVIYRWRPERPTPSPTLFRGPYPRGGWYLMGADSLGGNVVNWLSRLLGCEGAEDAFFAAAEAAAGDALPVLRYDEDGARFQWNGLGLEQGPGHLARAGLILLTERLEQLCARLPEPVHAPVQVAGGGSRSTLWRSLIEQRLGVPCEPTEADPLRGAARMARDAFGGYSAGS